MNAPFKPEPFIETVHGGASVSVSKLKANPAAVIAEAQLREVAVLNRNRAVAYVISPTAWEYLCEIVADVKIAEVARERLDHPEGEIEIAIDDLV